MQISPDNVSLLNPLALVFTSCMGIGLVALPRRFATMPIVLVTCLMTFGGVVVVAGLHFTMLRILVLFGCVRLLARGEFRSIRWLRLDIIVLYWVAASVITYTLLWLQLDAFINRLGLAYDTFGLYFIFRVLIRDKEDIIAVSRYFAIVLVPVACCMIMEKRTGENPFSVFGGVPEFTQIREGTLRCQGPFGHPILAGTFGAVWIPMFLVLWQQKGMSRLFSLVGIAASTIITILSGSSGPIGTYACAIVALFIWPVRKNMRAVRWSIVGSLVVVQIFMNAPIWFIFAHMNFFSGSTGWHRSNLIDKTIRHFFDWWLLGTKDTISWGVWYGDITNQFISQAVRGGLITLVLYVYIVVLAFSNLGRAMRMTRVQPRGLQFLVFGIGATLFAHVMSFLSISYFDQNVVNFYLCIAMTAAVMGIWGRQQPDAIRETQQIEVAYAPYLAEEPYLLDRSR